MWLFEEPEGIEFECLSDTKKYDFALDESQRKDKDWRWRELWSAIAWSYMPIEERRKSRFPSKPTRPDFNTCPLCGGDLEVDEEYIQSMYGEAYMYESVQGTYFCSGCEEAGTYEQLLKEREKMKRNIIEVSKWPKR